MHCNGIRPCVVECLVPQVNASVAPSLVLWRDLHDWQTLPRAPSESQPAGYGIQTGDAGYAVLGSPAPGHANEMICEPA